MIIIRLVSNNHHRELSSVVDSAFDLDLEKGEDDPLLHDFILSDHDNNTSILTEEESLSLSFPILTPNDTVSCSGSASSLQEEKEQQGSSSRRLNGGWFFKDRLAIPASKEKEGIPSLETQTNDDQQPMKPSSMEKGSSSRNLVLKWIKDAAEDTVDTIKDPVEDAVKEAVKEAADLAEDIANGVVDVTELIGDTPEKAYKAGVEIAKGAFKCFVTDLPNAAAEFAGSCMPLTGECAKEIAGNFADCISGNCEVEKLVKSV